MSLIKFRKQNNEPRLNPQESAEQEAARIAVAESLAAARRMMGTREFAEFKAELAKSTERTIDLLMQMDEQELDNEKFAIRVRKALHKVQFLRYIEVIVENKAGGSDEKK